MKISTLKRSIEIFEKYDPDGMVHAEHDQIWMGPGENVEMSTEDREELGRLGWFEDEGSWSHFT
jgi:hypothetical protein